MKIRKTGIIILMMLTICGSYTLHAQTTRYWIGFGQTWSDNTAWGDVAGTPCNCIPDDVDPVIFNDLGADATIDIDLDARTGNFTMQNSYGGTINFGGFFLLNNGVATITGGTFDATGAADMLFTSLTVNGGTFNVADANSLTLNSLAVSSGTFHGGSSQIDVGGAITLSGTGTITGTSGTMSLFGATPSFNRSAGTFNNNGGTVFISPTSGTPTIANGLTFNNLGLDNSAGSPTARAFTIGTTVNINGSLTLSSSATNRVINLNTGTINLGGDLDLSNHTATAATTSTASIVFNGSGSQSFIGASAIAQGKIPQITINKSGGTLTMSSSINVNGAWTYTAGTVSPGSSTVTIYGTRSIGTSGMSFNNLNIGQGSGAANVAVVSLSSGLSVSGALAINSTCSLTTNDNTVSMGGNLTNSGTLVPGNTVFTCSGGSSQNLAFSNGSTLTIHTLTISKTAGTAATLTAALNISNQLNPTTGNFGAGTGLLTFLSTAAATSAQIGAVGGTLSGDYGVQRFISASRAWRFLCSPVNQTFNSSWQNGIYITGAGSGGTICPSLSAHSNGFDATLANAPSVYTYNEPTQSWVALANTNSTNTTPGVGFRVFTRGNRSQGCSQLDGSAYTPGTVTLASRGSFSLNSNYGDVTVSVTRLGDGWNLLGNPYQSTLDWNNATWVTARGGAISNEIHTINPSTGTYSYWVSGVGTNGGTQYISPGQAFFINANSSTSLIFKESYKNTAQNGTALFKTSSVIPVLYVQFNDVATEPKYTDESAIALRSDNGVTKGYDREFDAQTLSFGTGNIRTYNSGYEERFAINSIPALQDNDIDTVYVEVAHPAQAGSFTLTFRKQEIPAGMTMILVDNYTNQTMNLDNSLVYAYSTSADPASKAAGRFIIVLGGKDALPVTLSVFNAKRSGSKTEISWQTAMEKNNSHFIVERSTNNDVFEEVQLVKGNGNSVKILNYSCMDETPVNGKINYYRLKQVDFNGKYTLSYVVPVDFSNMEKVASSHSVSLFPVPASTTLGFALLHNYTGNVAVNVFNIDGKSVLTSEYQAGKFSSQTKLDISSLPTGIYHVKVTDQTTLLSESIKFVKE